MLLPELFLLLFSIEFSYVLRYDERDKLNSERK